MARVRWAEARLIRERLKPPPDFTLSAWADHHRVLSPEASAEPGPWRTDRAPYLRGILDACSDPAVETVVAMTASQVGKTEVILNVVGFHIHQDPAPILVLEPTEQMGQAWSKDRLAPMLRDSPALQGRVAPARSRDSGNTILHKRYPGGHLTVTGSNSAASLAMRPIRILLCDEVDRYAASAGTEGDPVNLARKRTATFWNRLVVMVSSPGLKGFSRIEAAYEDSDQRQFWVPCPHCGHYQVLRWENVVFENNDPSTARYACDGCGILLEESQKREMLAGGEWRARAPFRRVAGFHLSALYSPWTTWEDIVEEFLAAKGNPERLQVWVNTALAETWEEAGDQLSPDALEMRLEVYGRDPMDPESTAPEVPEGVGVLTAGVDVQGDRLEAVVKGWGRGMESWLIHYAQVWGDPGEPQVWADLQELLLRPWTHVSGQAIPVAAIGVDTGGHHTEAAYSWVRALRRRRAYALKGMAGEGRPILGRPSKRSKAKIPLYPVGTVAAKDMIFSRLRIQSPGPGYIHLPRWSGREYLEGLTAEKVVTRFHKGRPTRSYEKLRPRNEPLDLEVYALAALLALGPATLENLGTLADKLTGAPDEALDGPATEVAPTPRRVISPPRSSGWVTGWTR